MEEEANKYLNGLIKIFPKYSLTIGDKKQIEKEGLEVFILNRVLSHKYRKTAIIPEFREKILQNIKINIGSEKPIRFTIPTGGYKKWQFTDIAPEVDWSELFHLRFMIEYLAPIVAVYKPGVLLEYFANSWLIKRISYYPQKDLDAYTGSFRKLLETFNLILPKNFVIKYHVVADQLPEEQLLERISKNIEIVKEELSKLPNEKLQELLNYSERNIRWDILEKDHKLSEPEKEKLIIEGKVIHDALLKGGWNNDLYYLRNDNAIPIIHRKSSSEFLHVATCQGAYVQFWVGRGILRLSGNYLAPSIFSFDQYQNTKSRLKTIRFDGVKVRNFENIELLQEAFGREQ